jgi:small subunit ribosomal protein S12e
MDVPTALQQVANQAVSHRHIARGLNESTRALDQRKAVLCLLASNCNESNYITLIEALCTDHQIPLIKVDDNQVLGQWVGLCKLDEDGEPKKVVKCSCAVITAWGPETEAQTFIKNHISSSL